MKLEASQHASPSAGEQLEKRISLSKRKPRQRCSLAVRDDAPKMHLAAAVRWERADDLKEVMNFNAQGSEHRKLSSGESRYFLPWKQVSADGQQYPTGHTPSTLSTAARRLSRLVINGAEMVAQEPRDPNRYFRRPAVQCPDLGGGEQGAAIIITEVTLQLERPSSNHLAGWQCSCHCQQRPSSWGLSCSPSCLPAPALEVF